MKKAHLLPLAVALASTNALAIEQGQFIYNGFGTAGITHLGGESNLNYGIQGQTNDHWRGDQLSRIFVQGQYGITNSLSMTAQAGLHAQQDSWEAKPGNLYLAWQLSDNLTLRGGRIGVPVYMMSETLLVGFSYPWLRLPEEVYSLVDLTHHQGVDLLYSHATPLGALSVQIAAGSAKNEELYAFDKMHDVDYKDLFLTNLKLSTDGFGTFSIGYGEVKVKSTFSDTIINVANTPQNFNFVTWDDHSGRFFTLGHQYDNGTWLSAIESVRRTVVNDGQDEITAFYVMGGRRFGDFLAHVTHAQSKQNGLQASMTYGLNYSLTPSITLKSEFKHIHTSQSSLYPGAFQPNAQQAYDNVAFLQTSGAFGAPWGDMDGDIVSLGIDFIF